MKSSAERWIFYIACLLVSLAAIHIGLLVFNISLLHGSLIKIGLTKQLIQAFDILIGLAGLYTLVHFFMCAFGGKECSHF